MGAAPLNPPPRTSSTKWVFWLLGGCLFLVVVIVGAIVGVYYWSKNKITTYVEEQTDPAKREQSLKELLGAQTLPPGYHAGISMNLGLARTAWLSDRPMGEEGLYGERGFVFNESMRAGDAKAKVEQFTDGEGGNLVDEMGVSMRSDEDLGRGSIEVNRQQLRWFARRGEVTHSDEAVPGVYSVVLIGCGDTRERWAVWFQRVPSTTATGDFARAGSVVDEAAIRQFFSHFNLCR
ncbi:MAG TPA: hypothetical protein VNI54_11190 [Thermoanaerobaculia bacterium]|nr:hypothetical protein [Thermoanaerobaculia bacterium]